MAEVQEDRPKGSPASAREKYIASARSVLPVLLRNAGEADRTRSVPDENLSALREAGLLSLSVSRKFGGCQADMRSMIGVTSTLAEACASTAWVVANRFIGTWAASLLPNRGQEEIFGGNPNVGVAGSFQPGTEVTRVEGGLRVSGKWYYCSGITQSEWGLVGLLETDNSGKPKGVYFGFLPREEFTVEDTWFTTGMRGTASHCISVREATIPDHRLLPIRDAVDNRYPREDQGEALYRSTFGAFLPMNLAGPLLGLARAALKHVIDSAPKRGIANTFYRRQADSSAFLIEVARAATRIDTAHLHIERATHEIDRAAEDGVVLDVLGRGRARADMSHAVSECTEAINALVKAHGAGSFAESSVMQRIWRDANVASSHGALATSVCLEVYGRILLNRSDNIVLVY